ncbi:hypothetical protein ACH5RR_017094 [Cinchona calisaya]|uniref:Uncharacterized protein n=1 Tax=Cinchona calisaya TaxID=153742 RepID=A0ABD3A117_9GENT
MEDGELDVRRWEDLDIDILISNPQESNKLDCPRLKRLVMPVWNRIKKTGICRAIRMWKGLESLTRPSIANPLYLMEKIAKNGKKFSELKIMGPCDIFFASTLAAFVPNLKVLSLRCSTL